MSVRIVEEALTKGWRGSFADALALLPGPVREVTQDARVSKSDEAGASRWRGPDPMLANRPSLVLWFQAHACERQLLCSMLVV